MLCEDEEVLRWFAWRLSEEEFVGPSRVPWETKARKKMWRDVRRESELAVVLAGRRRSLRLPPELWELVDADFVLT